MENADLLDLAKERANLKSDYALAKVLGITPGNLSNIRKNKAHPSNEIAIKLATLAGLDELRVIAEIELRTANTDNKKAFWTHFLESRSVAGCVTMGALTALLLITPEHAQASTNVVLHNQNYVPFYAQLATMIYIMRKKREAKAERLAE